MTKNTSFPDFSFFKNFSPLKSTFLSLLPLYEIIINRALQYDPKTPSSFEKLNGKRLKITITDLNLSFSLLCTEKGIHLNKEIKKEEDKEDINNKEKEKQKEGKEEEEKNRKEIYYDAEVSGPWNAFLSLLLWKDPQYASKMGLTVEGDTEFANDLQSLFLNLDIDWEEALSKVTGDTIAHQVGNFVNKTHQKQKEILNSLGTSFSTYVQEEAKILPTPAEVQEFMHAVDILRNEVDRIEARINLLEQKL